MLKVLGKGSSFSDFKRVLVSGGQGGDGCIAFEKVFNKAVGPPCGGNGGRGGDVFITASKNITCLGDVKKIYKVEGGQHGRGKTMHGPDGTHTFIVVPIGTVVRQLKTGMWKQSLN